MARDKKFDDAINVRNVSAVYLGNVKASSCQGALPSENLKRLQKHLMAKLVKPLLVFL